MNEETPQPPRQVEIAIPSVPPRVTYAIIGVTVFVYLLQMASKFFLNGADLPAYYGMKSNDYILAGQFWRFLTPLLLHGSIMHIGFNMYALLVIGAGIGAGIGVA